MPDAVLVAEEVAVAEEVVALVAEEDEAGFHLNDY
jgi:hypothetical protein